MGKIIVVSFCPCLTKLHNSVPVLDCPPTFHLDPLKVHPEKTRIVYCKKDRRPLKGRPVQFDFLGFSFLPVMTRLKRGGSFLQYSCKMSRKSKKRILQELRSMELHRRSRSNIQDLAKELNPKIRGWINYYGKIRRNSLKPIFYYLHHRINKMDTQKVQAFQEQQKTCCNLVTSN